MGRKDAHCQRPIGNTWGWGEGQPWCYLPYSVLAVGRLRGTEKDEAKEVAEQGVVGAKNHIEQRGLCHVDDGNSGKIRRL